MMNYRDISASNQTLFGELEYLTLMIAHHTTREQYEECDRLQRQKDGIRALINVNLELLGDLWSIASLRAYKRPKVERSEEFEDRSIRLLTNRERDIIAAYIESPGTPIAVLAAKFDVGYNVAHRVITAYLTQKYNNA